MNILGRQMTTTSTDCVVMFCAGAICVLFGLLRPSTSTGLLVLLIGIVNILNAYRLYRKIKAFGAHMNHSDAKE
jgi:hypothetical protein